MLFLLLPIVSTMKIFKILIGHYHYRRYLQYKSWNTTWALEALYKSFYSDYKKAEDEIDRLRYKNRNNNKTDWRKRPDKLLRLM